ncbi:MAG: TolC family protein [Leptolyngbya sp. PLA3]|nr:MAG: TolC family protein [Cyanobacteria bacterium CYA]MCE7969359.1 TolC family protein [Leptolyngbya sp. PL-A3]
MQIRAIHAARAGRTLISCAAALVQLAGCAATRPDPAAEAAASTALGLGQPIEFRTDGGPVDESPVAGDTLTLGEAVRRAATTDPGVQAALARVRIAMADADQARLLPNPVLNFVLRWGPGSPQIEVSLAQDLIQALKIPRQSSAADNRLRQAAADAVTVALDTVADVQERYIAVQTLESLVPVLVERRELLDKLVSTARARLEAQEGTRSDLTTLEAQRVELDVDIAEARRQLREERLRLARLIGEPSGPAAWRVDPWTAPALASTVEARWIDAGLQNRPEVQSVAWTLAALGDDAALARLLPWEGLGVSIDAQRDGDWSVGPSVSTPIPLFDTGHAARARVTAAQIEARHSLTLARRKVVEEVRVAFQSLAAGAANLHLVQSELIPLQQQRRQQAEDAYRAGYTDVTALLLAEQDLRAARAKAIEVEQQVSVALVRLQRAVGGPGVAATLGQSPPTTLPAVPVSSLIPIPTVNVSHDSNR